MEKQPLSVVRVAEFSWVIAGPLASKYLALMGAEVIKVESRKRPEFRQRDGSFPVLNHNKKSCSLDLSKPRARTIAREIVRRSAIVVENFGTGVMDRLGLGYEALSREQPDLIMLSCSGLGRTGPDRDKLAFGTLLQLYSGWSLMQGHPGTDDIVMGGAWGDPLAAAMAAFAILTALHHRERTGEGQYIDLSLLEASACGLPQALMDYEMNERLPERQGNRDASMAPHGCYPCRGDDKWIGLAVRSEEEWTALCGVMGNPPWTREERFADMSRRWQHQDALDAHLAQWTATHEATELMEMLQAEGIPAGPSLNTTDLLADPHLQARGVFTELAAPQGGSHFTIGAPWSIEPGLQPTYTPAPNLGEDNDYVLRTLLGMSRAEIDQLEADQVLF